MSRRRRRSAVGDLAAYHAETEEEEMQETIRAAANQAGCLYHHEERSDLSYAGFVDTIVETRSGLVAALELKTMAGRVTPEQRRWLEVLTRAGIPAYVVRPEATADAISLEEAVGLIGGSLVPERRIA